MNDPLPKITVLMPVYNGAAHLREAVDSILNQTFPDFEFLIIDDGSTDTTAEIVRGYSDPRIRLIQNHKNRGFVASLNKGVHEARGEYLARMDCDDISLPDRLEKQMRFMEDHPDTGVIATTVSFIDCNGNSVEGHFWREDRENITKEQIRATLPKTNCVAHPTVFMRHDIFRKGYFYRGKDIEDYELWIRLCAGDIIIEKIDAPLVKYRLTTSSITRIGNRSWDRGLRNIMRAKRIFLFSRKIFSPNRFTLKVFFYFLYDVSFLALRFGKYLWKSFFLKCGKILYSIWPMKFKSNLFFFFPFYHVGGSEKVHGAILRAVKQEKKPNVFISHICHNNFVRRDFAQHSFLYDLSLLTNFLTRYLLMGYLVQAIRRREGARVFGANSDFFYELIGYLPEGIWKMDLIHGLSDPKTECYKTRSAPLLDRRIVVSSYLKEEFRKLYVIHGVDVSLIDRMSVIENKIAVPENCSVKDPQRLRVLYVGRGSPEKRVHLAGKVAAVMKRRHPHVDFIFIGNVKMSVNKEDRSYIRFLGNIFDINVMKRHYAHAHILILTSEIEGFPFVIMEAMAYGAVPVTTNVGGINIHIKDQDNGIVVDSAGTEEEIVQRFVGRLDGLLQSQKEWGRLSQNAYRYAKEHFNDAKFAEEYRRLLIDTRMALPMVSIIMPFRNAENHIRAALDSLLSQTYQNFEIIIIDDDSQDGSAEIILSYNDPRIIYYKNPNHLGVGKTLNRAVTLCRGEFIARMDADDVSYPERLEKQVEFLTGHPDVGVVASRVEYIDETGLKSDFRWSDDEKIIQPSHIYWTLPRVNCLTHPSVMFRRGVIVQYPYDETVFAEDYELWLRLSHAGIKIAKIPRILVAMRKHKNSATSLRLQKTDGGIDQMIGAKKCFLNKTPWPRRCTLFGLLVSFFLVKDIFLDRHKNFVRLFWRDFAK